MTRRTAIGVVAVGLAIAACGGGSEELTSSTVAPATSSAPTTSPPTTASLASTTAPSTSPPTTVPPTTSPPTSTPRTTVSPTTAPPTTAPTSTSPPAPVGPATAFAVADERLVEVDVASGSVVRVVDELFSGDGVFRGGIRSDAARTTIWFSEGYEDGWFSCDSSVGRVGRIDLASGTIELVADGTSPELSADQLALAHLASGVCVPDPQQPDFWVLTPYDRVVLRDLASGAEREFVTDAPPDAYGAPGAVEDVMFTADGRLLVLLGDGRLFDVDPAGPPVIQDHPLLLSEVRGLPLATSGGVLLTVEFGDEGSTDLLAVDPGSGDATVLASAGAYMAVGVAPEGALVAASSDGVSLVPGSDVTVLEVLGDPFVADLDW